MRQPRRTPQTTARPRRPNRAGQSLRTRTAHRHRRVKARRTRIGHRLDAHTLERRAAEQLGANTIGKVELARQAPIAVLTYGVSRALGALVLVDTASHKTAGAALAL